MRLTSTRLEGFPKLMIIPMIDIIFFLLVFFMLNTLYMTNQQTVPVNLPQAASASTDVVKSLQVTVAKDGQLYLGTEPMSMEQLKARVRAESAGGSTALVLRADSDVDYGRFIAVLDELKRSGAGKISLAARQ
ncbi:MAG: biopolymer transporter ExbD [Anaerovibrio sp.]|uniref:ExbD/TolR family protein n=1 Tax=Anaerovibrio sp. TaxID=1872532 RepID=UPI002634304E|nr:biopolymer transporter ExbD [Anaerovibrio sp.]MDD7678395.1 biopolymer transporter ExbD [Anaerovibrio sp.]MDY2603044.1 biopolymer transporter ExbD [Anaerovibrio sp.]